MPVREKTEDAVHGNEKTVYDADVDANADKALAFLRCNNADAEEGTVVAVDEKALVRKIDWMIVPIMFACYFLQYLDKSLCKSHASVHQFLA